MRQHNPTLSSLLDSISSWIVDRLGSVPPQGLTSREVRMLYPDLARDIEVLTSQAISTFRGTKESNLIAAVRALSTLTPGTEKEARDIKWARQALRTPFEMWDATTLAYAYDTVQSNRAILFPDPWVSRQTPILDFTLASINRPEGPEDYRYSGLGVEAPMPIYIDISDNRENFLIYGPEKSNQTIEHLKRLTWNNAKGESDTKYSYQSDAWVVPVSYAVKLIGFQRRFRIKATEIAQILIDQADTSGLELVYGEISRRKGGKLIERVHHKYKEYNFPVAIKFFVPAISIFIEAWDLQKRRNQATLAYTTMFEPNPGDNDPHFLLVIEETQKADLLAKTFTTWREIAQTIGITGQAMDKLKEEEARAWAIAEQEKEEFEKKNKARMEKIALSKAHDADLPASFLARLGSTLHPFQKAGVKYLIQEKRTFLSDEQGTGKTIQALAALLYLDAFPALIVCPANVKVNWAAEAADWLPEKRDSISIIGLDRPVVIETKDKHKVTVAIDDMTADIVIINYDILDRNLEELKKIKWQGIIADESHRIKNDDATRTEAAIELVQHAKIPVRFALSGTPYMSRAEEMITQLHFLGRLDEFGGEALFKTMYKDANAGSVFSTIDPDEAAKKDAKHLTLLQGFNEKLRACCFVRREKADVLPHLPPKSRIVLCVEIDNREEYTEAELNFAKWLTDEMNAQIAMLKELIAQGISPTGKGKKAKMDVEFLESIKNLSEADQAPLVETYVLDRIAQTMRGAVIVQLNKLKKVAAKGKLAYAIDWIDEFLKSGKKLVVFAYHKEIVKSIAKRFNAPAIDGETDSFDKFQITRQFQNDPEIRLVVVNIISGREGITLTAAADTLFVELDWTPATHDQAEDRVHRIGQEAKEVRSWYLLGNRTIDLSVAGFIERKRNLTRAGISATLETPTEGRITACEVEPESGDLSKVMAEMLKKKRA